MRRAFVAVCALIAAAALTYTAVLRWLEPAAPTTTTLDGRPLASAEQPGPTVPQSDDASGYDVSYPQCRRSLPPAPVGFAIVGLNNGKPLSGNPCFAQQWRWAKRHQDTAVYINTADPGKGTPEEYGGRIAADTLARLAKHGVPAGTPVWLDIEASNTWMSAQRATRVINETMRVLTQAGHPVGLYAAPLHWFEITLNAVVDVPIWLPMGRYPSVKAGVAAARLACGEVAFGDRAPDLVQFTTKAHGRVLDHNLRCPAPAA